MLLLSFERTGAGFGQTMPVRSSLRTSPSKGHAADKSTRQWERLAEDATACGASAGLGTSEGCEVVAC